MARFAILSMPDAGHLYPLGAVGIELARRGHEVTVIARSKAAAIVEQLSLPFCGLEMDDVPWPSDLLLWLAYSAVRAGLAGRLPQRLRLDGRGRTAEGPPPP